MYFLNKNFEKPIECNILYDQNKPFSPLSTSFSIVLQLIPWITSWILALVYWLYRFNCYWKFPCGPLLLLLKLGGKPIAESCFFFCAFHRQVIINKRRLAAVAESNTPTGTIQIPQFTSLLASSSTKTNQIWYF